VTGTVSEIKAVTETEERDWRGVSAEDVDELPEKIGIVLRARSRRLLASLLRPHRRVLWFLVVVVLIQNSAAMVGPWLVGVGIDKGIPALVDGDWTPLLVIGGLLLAAAGVDAWLRAVFLLRAGRMGQAVLLDLRRRLFDHVQRLSPAFHERYTSGRVIARLTSDVDALDELLDEGLDGLVTALLSVVSIGVILLVLDLPLALVTLATFIPLYFLSRWFRSRSFAAYRRTRVANAALIVQFVESLAGIRAVQAFRREPRNGQIFEQLNQDVRVANARSFRLMALFVPGVAILGTIATVAALLYGGIRVLDGAMQVGVLTSFLLYLRRFFDPMQDIAVFFNSFQSASAALEKAVRRARGAPERARAGAPDAAARPARRGDVPVGAVRLPGRGGAAAPRPVRAGRADRGAGRRDRRRQDHDRPAAGPLLRPGRGPGAARRRRPQATVRSGPAPVGGAGDPGELPVLRLGRGQHRVRPAGSQPGRGGRGGEAIGAHEFIEALPEGYDTDVRKRGGRLSAGQRQLVAFARAFLADPGRADPRRGDLVAGRAERAGGAAGAADDPGRAHLADHRAPAVHGGDRRPGAGAGGRPGGRGRVAGRARRRRGPVRRAAPAWRDSLV
jgi:hypothetical protein